MSDLESEVQKRVLLEASRKGIKLFRNNNGAGKLENGKFIRFGLANTSSAINSMWKSSDLVGFTSIEITADMVGKKVAVFTSIETKKENWTYKSTYREVAQKRWIDMIVDAGGIAYFSTGEVK